MKVVHPALIVICLLLLASCNFKSDKSPDLSDRSTFQVEVGKSNNGNYIVTATEAIKQDWESRLNDGGETIVFENFQIVKGHTDDKSHKEYYLLLATVQNGLTKAASLLTLTGDSFMIVTQEDSDGSHFYANIVCEGTCKDGCLPVATLHDDNMYLNCSPCAKCQKSETEIR